GGGGTHAELLRRDDEVGDHYRSVVARTMNAAEPRAGEDLDTAMTGAIEQLWQEAVQTGAIPAAPPSVVEQAAERPSPRPGAPTDVVSTALDHRNDDERSDDAAAAR